MAINDIVQTIAEARVDARSLSEFVFKPSGFKVTRRLSPTIDTLQFYVNSLSLAVTEAQGKVEYIETTVQAAINSTAVEGGVLADTFLTVENTISQRQVNRGLSSVLDLQLVIAPVNAMRITVKSFYANKGCGGGSFEWQSDKDKAEANGGTIIDPSVFGAYDGTHGTIEDYLLAQGTGVGTGCWVAIKQRVIDATRFGLLASGVDVPSMDRADISAPLQRSIEVAAKPWSNGVVRLPAGYMTLRKRISHDFGGGTQKSLIIDGQGGHTQIDSKVIAQDSFEFFNASSVKFKSVNLYGNKLTDFLGNGHGIAFKSKKIGNTYPQLPNGIEVYGGVISGFAGNSVAGSGEFSMRSAGLFFDKGVINKVYDTSVTECFHGVFMYKSQQMTLRNVVSVDNIFSNVFGYELIDTATFDSCNLINIGDAARVETHSYLGTYVHQIQAACAIFYQCTGMININNIKTKGEATAIRSFDSRSIRINNCFVRAPVTGLPAIVVEGVIDGCKITIRDCNFDSSVITAAWRAELLAKYPSSGYDFKARGVLVKADNAGFRHTITVDDCDFRILDKWDYGVKIKNASITNVTGFCIRNNRVKTHDGAGYGSYLDDFFVYDTGVVHGEFTNNTFYAYSTNKQINGVKNVTTLVNTSTAVKAKMVVYGNEYFAAASVGSTAEILNKALPDVLEGEVTVESVTAGNFAIPMALNAKPSHVTLSVILVNGALAGSQDIFLQPASESSASASAIVFRAINKNDGSMFAGSLRVVYRASTGART